MDPVTAQLLIRLGSELALVVIKCFKSAGQTGTAAEIARIVAHSDAVAADIVATAQAELAALGALTDPRLPLDPD